ncbi:hypothetical protein MAMC_01027 [Methylacidimicrobium cyclopophantes]|uniref:Uncharacterized protein n=1 Tax=Methylacidimicrobium cyclopophantes TaxID=1041766 RepID=A0A5E6MA78_9BACT|nr:DUF692 domain-containing protein [Methylacidimicrobium cyclopophantes]VVM06305.1 hypothetical protein MAMC_01027 [Methylacidimicrobium cyclopophantes]
MPINRFNAFSGYGIGIGLRVPHYDQILREKAMVDWFELLSENFLAEGGRQRRVLDRVLEQYRVVLHGVGLYFGSAEPLDRDHLRRIKALVRRTGTPWLSDHLCWGSADGRYSHDLLPMPFTMAAARHTAAKIRQAADFLEVPVSVENISSYAELTFSTMTEWEFLSEVAELADCGILLDVNNVYIVSQNHGFDPHVYLDNIPHERVAQIHIGGHSRLATHILDTHDQPVADPVWKLYGYAIRKLGPTPTLLEWDDRIPPFEEVHREARKANRFLASLAPAQP